MKNGFGFGCLAGSITGGHVAFSCWTGYAVFVLGDGSVYVEYGPIENLQLVVLAAAGVLFALPSVMRRGTNRLIPIILALLCLTFMIRELDIKHLDVHWAIKLIGSSRGQAIILGSAFLVVLGNAAFHFSRYKTASLAFFRTRSGILLVAGGALMLLGDLCEKSHGIPHNIFFEETFELYGYCLILLSALSVTRTTGFFEGACSSSRISRSLPG